MNSLFTLSCNLFFSFFHNALSLYSCIVLSDESGITMKTSRRADSTGTGIADSPMGAFLVPCARSRGRRPRQPPNPKTLYEYERNRKCWYHTRILYFILTDAPEPWLYTSSSLSIGRDVGRQRPTEEVKVVYHRCYYRCWAKTCALGGGSVPLV